MKIGPFEDMPPSDDGPKLVLSDPVQLDTSMESGEEVTLPYGIRGVKKTHLGVDYIVVEDWAGQWQKRSIGERIKEFFRRK